MKSLKQVINESLKNDQGKFRTKISLFGYKHINGKLSKIIKDNPNDYIYYHHKGKDINGLTVPHSKMISWDKLDKDVKNWMANSWFNFHFSDAEPNVKESESELTQAAILRNSTSSHFGGENSEFILIYPKNYKKLRED